MIKSKKLIECDHFKNYQYPGKIEVSSTGTIAYTVSSVDLEKDSYPARLFVKRNDCANTEDVIDASHLGCFFWDDEKLFISALTDENDKKSADSGASISVMHLYDCADKSLTKLFKIEKTIEYAARLSEGRWLLLCKDSLVTENDFIASDEFPLRLDGDGYVCNTRRRAYIYTNGTLRMVTSDNMNIDRFKAYCNEYAVFCGNEHTGFLGDETSLLYRLDLKTFETSIIDCEKYMYSDLYPLDSDEIIAVRSDGRQYGDSQDHYIDKISLGNASFERLNGDCRFHMYCGLYADLTYGSSCKALGALGKDALFIATDADMTNIYRGRFEKNEILNVTGSDMVISDFKTSGGSIYMIASERLSGPEIWRIDETGGVPVKITDLNGWIDEQYLSVEPASFRFTTKDETCDVTGYVMKPADFDEGRKYPAVLFIHGGPNSAYGGNYFHETQLMASKGYGVIYCNPRGSIGYGAEFADLRGKYYTVDYDDIMQFLDEAISRCDWIDSDRLAVTGGSYGGMMTNWVITHSERFKAAASDCCCVNEIADFFLSDIGFSFANDVHRGSLWDKGMMQKMWDKSPIKYAPAAKTPTLFIHGADDFRCSAEQSMQMFAALRFHGVPARAVIMKGEHHSLDSKPKDRIRRFEEILSWFNKHLGGGQNA